MATARCPICKKRFDPAASSTMPFCSERCQQIDLGRWIDERYSLPLPPSIDEDEAEEPLDDHDPEGPS